MAVQSAAAGQPKLCTRIPARGIPASTLLLVAALTPLLTRVAVDRCAGALVHVSGRAGLGRVRRRVLQGLGNELKDQARVADVIMSPSLSLRGSVTRSRLTQVPLLLPRSSIQYASVLRWIRACRREAAWSATTMWL